MDSPEERLLSWFAAHARPLPWRLAPTPYHVWISEIMLQQTQVERVATFYRRWCAALPDIAAVAAAPEEEVLKLWEGLGYYSRARNILRAARLVVRDHGGRVPEEHGQLLALPGIGPYTAGAIMSLAFNQAYPAVDANVLRVMARLHDIATPVKKKKVHTRIEGLAAGMIPAGRARDFNQALMELGALVCLPGEPRCDQCPMAEACLARDRGTVVERPVPLPRTRTIRIEMATGVLCEQGRMFIQKRPATGVWANLWEFPGGRVEKGEEPGEAVVREYQEETELEVGLVLPLTTIRHSYTVYRVTLHCFSCRLARPGKKQQVALHAAQEYRWITARKLQDFAFPAGHRKLIDHLLRSGRLAELLKESG